MSTSQLITNIVSNPEVLKGVAGILGTAAGSGAGDGGKDGGKDGGVGTAISGLVGGLTGGVVSRVKLGTLSIIIFFHSSFSKDCCSSIIHLNPHD